MKVYFQNMLAGYTGSADGMTYYYDRRLNRVLARRKPRVKINLNHLSFGETVKNLMRINPSPGFRDDLRTYAERTYKLPEFGGVRPIWNNLYFKIMFGLKTLDPVILGLDPGISIDLLTITRAYIELHDLPCRSVRRAVEAGLLPELRGYQELTREM